MRNSESESDRGSDDGCDPHSTTVNSAGGDTLPDRIDNRYRVLRRLGGGTFGTVYQCCDETLQVTVAVKVPGERACGSPALRAAFLTEARTLAGLDHPQIMKVRDYREMSDGRCYAVFEFVAGMPLDEHLTRLGPDRVALVNLIADVAQALHAVHVAELVHRDIKPANVLVRSDGSICLVDFGIALSDDVQRDHAGEFAGTPAYMAPEQVRREAHLLDGRADLWALGVILYEALTGQRPFQGRTLAELLEEILHREPKPPRLLDRTIPRVLELIVLSCLRKPPGQRPATAADLADELRSPAVADALLRPVADEEARPRPRTRWASDGNLIDIALLKDVVFETPLIKAFLESAHQYFISANKGLGKTLLLRYKRSLLTDEYTQEKHEPSRPAVQFIPEGRPYLDFMGSELPSLSRGHHKFLATLRNCKRMWSFALRTSTISYFPDIAAEFGDADSHAGYRHVREWLRRSHVQPTAIFRDMLSLSVRDLNQLLDDCENRLDYLFCRIHSGVYIFVDRVEQGLTSLPRDGWINVQAGLLEAAWDLMSANSHVKIYATIREEAYANYESDVRANYHSATVALRYSVDDLRQLIDKLAEFYEGRSSFEEFVGLTEVRSPHSQIVEDSFSYLRRHTVGRPRDLVIICSELSKRLGQLIEPVYRDIVNDISSHVIVGNVFTEMSNLIECLGDRTERQRFFGLLPANILTYEDLKTICCRFNGLEQANYEDLHHAGEILHHPFCDLYNCGLLGLVRQNPHDGVPLQHFKQPHDVLGAPGGCLPASDYYLIHPSLQSLINQQRAGNGYQTIRFITVGHKYPWHGHFPPLIAAQRALPSVPDPELREEIGRILKWFAAARSESAPTRQMTESDVRTAVRSVQQTLERLGCVELFLALDELVSRHLRV